MNIKLQIYDHIGYERYKEIFLEPLENIRSADIASDAKKRYSKLYVNQLAHYLGSSLFSEDDNTAIDGVIDFESINWVGIDFEVNDPNLNGVYFSEVYLYALEAALKVFHDVLIKYRLGRVQDGRFITDYYLQSIDIMNGSVIVLDTRDRCTP